MARYNFWGIAPEGKKNHPWNGLTGFKKGFGGEAHEYLHAQDLPCSPLYILPKTIETIRRIKKGY
jgi:lipid II:glycine glycyltransferase (peptidoglycan interpeptide bridge formation enzyme)